MYVCRLAERFDSLQQSCHIESSSGHCVSAGNGQVYSDHRQALRGFCTYGQMSDRGHHILEAKSFADDAGMAAHLNRGQLDEALYTKCIFLAPMNRVGLSAMQIEPTTITLRDSCRMLLCCQRLSHGRAVSAVCCNPTQQEDHTNFRGLKPALL